jgi:repressor LexA
MGRTPTGQTRRRIYEFVRGRLLEGAPPTIREVQEAFGFRAVQSAREHLEALVAEGLLAKEPGRSRGYRLPDAGGSQIPTRLVPLLGHVQAGELTTALEDPEGYLPIRSRRPEKDLFALRVRGDSMTGAGILEDDIVIVRKQPSADNGEIVVALVGDEATVKRFHRRGRSIELRPENPDFEIISPEPGELSLLGKVIEVHRYLEHPPLLHHQ